MSSPWLSPTSLPSFHECHWGLEGKCPGFFQKSLDFCPSVQPSNIKMYLGWSSYLKRKMEVYHWRPGHKKTHRQAQINYLGALFSPWHVPGEPVISYWMASPQEPATLPPRGSMAMPAFLKPSSPKQRSRFWYTTVKGPESWRLWNRVDCPAALKKWTIPTGIPPFKIYMQISVAFKMTGTIWLSQERKKERQLLKVCNISYTYKLFQGKSSSKRISLNQNSLGTTPRLEVPEKILTF